MTATRSQSTVVSLALHLGLIFLLLLASTQVTHPPVLLSTLGIAKLAPYIPRTGDAAGGGGARNAEPATAGRLPTPSPRQFVPPTLEVPQTPKLAMNMSIEAPPDLTAPDRGLSNIGDPLSKFLNNSAGSGGPLGIGEGKGTGVGSTRGPGAGHGDGGDGVLGTVYRPGNGVTAPVLLRHIDPEFSEEARRAKYSGTVRLRAVIDASGRTREIIVVQSLGMGLDEKAVEAVKQWLFKPGTKDGKPVPVSALVDVMFHLL